METVLGKIGPSKPTDPLRRPPWSWVVAGVVVALAGVGALVWSSGLERGSAEVVGANRPVNAGAADPLDQTAHNSPALRVNPMNPAQLAVASRIDSPDPSCALHVSRSAGASWSRVAIPSPEGHEVACFAPDVAFGADGTLHVVFTSFAPVEQTGIVPDAVWLSTSRDGGRTMSQPSRIHGPLAFEVRLAADPARPGRLYLAWLAGSHTSNWGFAEDGNPIVVSRSDDGGETWRAPVEVSPPARRRVVAPSLAVDRGGAVLVSYLDVKGDRLDYYGAHEGKGGEPYPGTWSLVVARSGDGARTWKESVPDAGVVPSQRFLVLSPPTPSIAADPEGDGVYVAFHDGRLGDADVWLWASGDGGRRWRRAERVNDTTRRDGRSQYLPQVTVAPSGRIDVVYYDRRADPDDVMNEVSLQSSFDGGRAFRARVRLSDRPFDSRIGYGSDRGMPDLGDRLGLLATDDGALGMWTDTRAGFVETGKQDLASSVVAISAPDGRRRPLTALAWIVAVVGAAAALGSWAARRRQRPLDHGETAIPASVP